MYIVATQAEIPSGWTRKDAPEIVAAINHQIGACGHPAKEKIDGFVILRHGVQPRLQIEPRSFGGPASRSDWGLRSGWRFGSFWSGLWRRRSLARRLEMGCAVPLSCHGGAV